ncbi:MAG: hypothetical protein JNM51_17090 [Bacteroidia bacterium]|nr:hypothetical protein [Bacteroidia bacterium]
MINLLAWGYVGYRIYTALQGDDDLDMNFQKTEIKKIEEAKKEDSLFLSLNYPDPFLKGGNFSKERKSGSKQSNNQILNSQSKTPVLQLKPKAPEPAPVTLDVRYIGLVKNNDKGTTTAMITINGKSYFVKQNDIIESLLIQEISPNTLKIKKGKELLVITK